MGYDRRRFVQLTGLVAAGGLAGCLGDGGDSDGGDTGGADGGAEDGDGDGSSDAAAMYGWQDATWDAYWYSLYNMNVNIAMSGNGVRFPHNQQQRDALQQRLPAITRNAEADGPPVRNTWLNMAAFTRGDPSFTEEPDFGGEGGGPDASTMRWDPEGSSQTVSPSSLAWTHLKGVTWAKNFQNHFDVLPERMVPRFRAQVLTTLAQIGINAALIQGGPQGNGALTKGESLELVSRFRPGAGVYAEDSIYTPPENPGYPDRTSRPHHHAAMLWFLADMNSLAQNGWFGYVNPEPLIPAEKIQGLTDGVARATMEAFSPEDVASMEGTRSVGLMLAAVGYYAPQAGGEELRAAAADYVEGLAGVVEDNLAGNGRVENGARNQAATQGIVGQGLVWATETDGVHHADTARNVLGYMFDELWIEDAGTFTSGRGDTSIAITARDAGDVTGGINAADAVLGMSGVKEVFARYFNHTFNRGRLQRAERPPSRDEDAEFTLPLPSEAGGRYGQAAVYNAEVEYDVERDEWSVTDAGFDTEAALYLANQDIWISQWGGEFFEGRGVPGTNVEPPG